MKWVDRPDAYNSLFPNRPRVAMWRDHVEAMPLESVSEHSL